jgi:ABC-type multidrug transport system ATPase subunit
MKGSVRVFGTDPFRHPSTRRTIGSALGSTHFEETSIRTAIARRLRLRGSTTDPTEVSARFGLELLLDQHPAQLSERERQAIALAIALSIEEPKLLALYEPEFQSALPIEQMLSTLSEHAKTAVVLCATASPRTAALLSPNALLLQDGRLVRAILTPTRPAFAASGPAQIRIESDACAQIAHAVSGHPAVTGIQWEAGSDVLYLAGPETEELCLLVVAKATQHQLTIRQLSQALPEPTEIRATHAALARAAFDRAYGAMARGGAGQFANAQTPNDVSPPPVGEVDR